MTEVKKRGPAPKPDAEVKRRHITFRILGSHHEQLKGAADQKGRSISEEIEHRLSNSLEDDRRFGEPESLMIGRRVGETVTIASKRIFERKIAEGQEISHSEWWREPSDRDHVREKMLDIIEMDWGKSDRWMMPPADVAARVQAWIDAKPETEIRPTFQDAVLQLLASGLDAAKGSNKR